MKELMKKLLIAFTVLFVLLGALSFRVNAEEDDPAVTEEETVEVTGEEETGEPAEEEAGEPARNIQEWITSGTCEWMIDDEYTLIIRPKNGAASGTLASWIWDNRVPWYSYRYSIKSVIVQPGVKAATCYAMFLQFKNCESMDLSGLDTSNATTMQNMFNGCSSLTELDVSNFNTSKVTRMDGMFRLCSGLTTIDLSGFDTKNVTHFTNMFGDCTGMKRLDLSSWNTIGAKDMATMFSGCTGLTDLNVSNWKTGKVTNFNATFNNCSSLTSLDVTGFDTSSATHLGLMFGGCSSLTTIDVSNFKTDNVTSLNGTFSNCTNLKELDLSNWNTTNVRDASMFYNNYKLIWLNVGPNFCPNSTSYAVPNRPLYSTRDNQFYGFSRIPYNIDESVVYTFRYDITYDGLPDVHTYVYYKEKPVVLNDGSELWGDDTGNKAEPDRLLSKASIEKLSGTLIAWDTEVPVTKVVFEPGSRVDFDTLLETYGESVDSIWGSSDKTLYWGIKMTINYDPNGGENGPDPESIIDTSDPKQFVISSVSPKREGYEFLGWASEAAATEPEYVAGDPITLTDDMTLFAVWKKNAEPTPDPTPTPDTPYVLPKTGVDSIGMSYLPMAALGVLYLIKKNYR